MGFFNSASVCHLSSLAWSERSFSSIAKLIKLCQDLSLVLLAFYLNMGCFSFFNCFAFSRSVVTFQILSGEILDRQYVLFIGFGRRHLVINRQVSLSATSTYLTCFDLLYIGYAYSPADKHNASPVVLIVCVGLYWVFKSFLNRLLLVCIFIFILIQCFLNVGGLSNVTLR